MTGYPRDGAPGPGPGFNGGLKLCHQDGGPGREPEGMYVYYYRTYEKAVSGGGRGGKRRTCAKGPYQPRPVRSSLATVSDWYLTLVDPDSDR